MFVHVSECAGRATSQQEKRGLEPVGAGWAQMFENGFIKWGEGEKSHFSD